MAKELRFRGNQVNWNHLYYFTRIALYGSIKDAAKELALSPSTLSEQLAQLEDDLEVKLFLRRHRKLLLSTEGHRLFAHTKQLFENSQRLLDALSPLPLGAYPLRVGITPGPSMQLAKGIIGAYLRRFGAGDLHVVRCEHSDLEKSLGESRYDFAFSDRGTADRALVAVPIATSSLRFFVSRKLEAKSLEELFSKYPLVVCSAELASLGFVDDILADLEVSPQGQIRSEYPSLAFELCDAGLGIGAFSELAVKGLGLDLVPLKLPKSALRVEDRLYGLWSKESENSEAVKRLRELLEEAKDKDPWTHFGLGRPSMVRE